MVFPSTLLKSREDQRCAVRVRFRDPERHAGLAFPLPGERRLRALALRSSRSARGSRRWTRSSCSTTCSCRGSGCFSIATWRAATRPTRAPARSCNMAHQVVVKNIAKTEFLLGLASLLVDTIAVESFQHIQEKLAEIWVNLETMKALLRAAEADAALDEWGVMRPAWNPLDAARNLFPRLYPRMVEIIQQIGASGLCRDADRARPPRPARRGHQAVLPGRARRRVRPHPAVPARVGHGAVGVRRRGRCSTSGSSSATRSGWRARSLPVTMPRSGTSRRASVRACAQARDEAFGSGSGCLGRRRSVRHQSRRELLGARAAAPP